MHPETKGVILVLIGCILFTPDALLLRLPQLSFWDVTFLRYSFSFIPQFLFLVWEYKGIQGLIKKAKKLGLLGYLCGTSLSIGSLTFVLGMRTVGAANTMVIYSSFPMISALLGICILKEFPDRGTWLAIFICIGSVLFVVSSQLKLDVIGGNLAALASAFGFAFFFVFGRLIYQKYGEDSLIAIVYSSVNNVFLSLCFRTNPANIPWISYDVLYLFIEGFCIYPLSFSLETLAAKYIGAAEIGLIMLLEVVLGPLCVWLVLHERPSMQDFIGGGILVTTLAIHSSYIIYSHKNEPDVERKKMAGEIEKVCTEDLDSLHAMEKQEILNKIEHAPDVIVPKCLVDAILLPVEAPGIPDVELTIQPLNVEDLHKDFDADGKVHKEELLSQQSDSSVSCV